MPDDALFRLRPAVDRQTRGSYPKAKARHYASSHTHPRIPEASVSGRGQCLCGRHGLSGHSDRELDEAGPAHPLPVGAARLARTGGGLVLQ
eukprot:3095496-Pleurochrysis_carterae.AAC.1